MISCPECNQSNREQARFCRTCGAPLDDNGAQAGASPSHNLQPGMSIQERYTVLKQIGEGGLGRVFLAEDRDGRRYAVKQIREYQPDEDRQDFDLYMRSFQREARILSSLPHPYLPIARDFVITPDNFLIIMDYIEGKTLAEVLENSPTPLPEERVLLWGIQVCEALSYLHRKNPPIIHRNIKPKNIILEEGDNEKLRLIGFGLARFYQEELDADEDQIGTPGYSPPEQYGTAQTDPRSDIYSLGATLYALLTKDDLEELSSTMILEKPGTHYPDLQSINSKVSERTSQAVMKALRVAPAERFQSAEEMRAELEEILSSRKATLLVERFLLGEPVPYEETFYCEFKEIQGDDPLPSIKRNIEEYVVAFLNSEGGRIFWGIRDTDRTVTGVLADYRQRDNIRRLITDKVISIQPAIAPSALRINFHAVYKDEQPLKNLFVIEVIVPRVPTNYLYFTCDNRVFVKTEAGKKQMSGPEIQDEIIRRLKKGPGGLSVR